MTRWLARRRPIIRIGGLLVVLAALVVLWRWDPNAPDEVELAESTHGRFDRSDNGLWMRRHWIHEGDAPPDTDRLAEELRALGVRRIYPFLGPMDAEGWPGWRADEGIRRYRPERARAFFEALHAADPDLQILPWTGGNRHQDFHPDATDVHASFAAHAARLVELGADGVHLNVEPMPDGSPRFLSFLRTVRAALPQGATLSIAAYPPTTALHPFDDIHWSLEYTRQVCVIADELAVMAYDTALTSAARYQRLVSDWTRELLGALPTRAEGGCDVLMGVSAYEDDEPWHDPSVETMEHSLRGILHGLSVEPLPRPLTGVAVYASWTTDEQEWATYDRLWRGRAPSGARVTEER